MAETSSYALLFEEIVGRIDEGVAVLVARELGIFRALLRGPRTEAELSLELKVPARTLGPMLALVAALGLIESDGERYSLPASQVEHDGENDALLSTMGTGQLRRLLETRIQSIESLREGRGIGVAGAGGEMGADERRAFLEALHRRSLEGARELAYLIGGEKLTKIADLGCGVGTYAVAILKEHPEAEAVLMDRPDVRPFAEALLAQEGLADRARFVGGDFLCDEFGNDFDVVVLSNVLHCLSPENNKSLLCRIADRLAPNGRLAIKDLYIAPNRQGPRPALRFAFRLSFLTSAGNVYTVPEIESWLRGANLTHQIVLPMSAAEGSHAIIARSASVAHDRPLSRPPRLAQSKVVIVGGGIAGLATAHQLLRHGYRVSVFERSPLDAPTGLGFLLTPGGLSALAELGLAEAVRRVGSPIRRARLRDLEDFTLVEQELDDALCLRRSDLSSLLRGLLPSGVVRHGKEFVGFRQTNEGRFSAARFADGSEESADFFVGADGVRSRVRALLFPDIDVNPVRVKELVLMTYAPNVAATLRDQFTKTLSPEGGLAVGVLPCGYGRVVWFIQYDCHRYEMEGRSPLARHSFAKELVRGWPEPIAELIERTDFAGGHVWHTTDFDPLPAYFVHNTVLVGDAAHTLLTFTSHGVTAALEDAVCFGRLVGEGHGDAIETTFRRFQETRRPALEDFLWQGREFALDFLRPSRRRNAVKVPISS